MRDVPIDEVSNSAPVVSVRGFKKTYRVGFFRKKVEAVRGIDFEVRKGEIFGLLGPNGAGKTSTLKSLLRLSFPTEGTMEIFGLPTSRRESMYRVGYMPENPSSNESSAKSSRGTSWRPPAASGVPPVTRTLSSAFHRVIRWLTSCGAGSSGTGSDFDVRRARARRWLHSATSRRHAPACARERALAAIPRARRRPRRLA